MMEPTSPRAITFPAESASPTRPVSRTSSTGTEVPGHVRSLTREVDHIKSLISRAQSHPPRKESSITAQVFRSRGSQHEHVTQAHIIHELDGLKRRIRTEKLQLQRRRSEADPDTESEAEDVIDERDEELDSIKEELHNVRLEREQWIGSAEERIDKLITEKEGLAQLLDRYRREWKSADENNARLEAAVKEAKKDAEEKSQALHHQQEASHDAEKARIASAELQKKLQESEISLAKLREERRESDERTQHAEEKHKADREHLLKELADHQADKAREIVDLQKRHEESSTLHDKTKALLTQNQTAHESALASLKTNHTRQLEDLGLSHAQSLDAERSRSKENAENRDSKIASLESNISDLKRDLSDARNTANAYEQSTKKLTSELEQAKARHEKELDEIKASAAKQLIAVQNEARENAVKAKQENDRLLTEKAATHDAAWLALKTEHTKSVQELIASHQEQESQYREEQDALQSDLQKLCEGHSTELTRLRSTHETALSDAQAELQEVRENADAKHSKLEESHNAELEALRATHGEETTASQRERDAELGELRASHDKEMEQLTKAHAAATSTLRSQHKDVMGRLSGEIAKVNQSLANLQQDHEGEIKTIRQHSDDELSHLQRRLSQAQETSDSTNKEQLQALKTDHERQILSLNEEWLTKTQRAADEHQAALQNAIKEAGLDAHRAQEDFKKRLDDSLSEARSGLSCSHTRQLEDITTGHSKALEELHDLLETAYGELAAARKHAEDLAVSQLAQRDQTGLSHEIALTELQSQHSDQIRSLQTELEQTRHTHEQTLASREKALAVKLEGLQQQHHEAITQAEQFHTTSADEKLREVETRHSSALAKALDDARVEADKKAAEAEASHKSALQSAEAAARAAHENELSALQQRNVETTEKVRHELQMQNETFIAKLQESGQQSKDLEEMRTRTEALTAELEQHGQNRRDLEELLQQKAHEAIQATEEKRSLERQLASLKQEMDTLAKDHAQTEHSLQELQDTIIEHQSLSTDEASRTQQELDHLKDQISEARKEKAVADSAVKDKWNEQSEIARQNDFLTRQLSELGAHLNVPRTPTLSSVDVAVQTSPQLVSNGVNSRGSIHSRNSVPIDSATKDPSPVGQVRPELPRSKRGSELFGPELKMDIPSSPLAKHTRHLEQGPSTPLSPATRAKQRTFEDYLKQAQVELSELGSVITANETLFAQKIQEHVGDLQKAKDVLALEYKEKFDALLVEKERLDKKVTLDHATEFVKEREQLVASYTSNVDQTAENLPSPQAKALHNAEVRLVHDFNRRVATRKSQIRLKHAEEFHTLTQDYDRKVADVLWRRSELEGDLSIDASKFEQDIDDMTRRSQELEEKRSSVYSNSEQRRPSELIVDKNTPEAKEVSSRLPKRSLTALPRSATSIPKAVPYAGNKDSVQVTSKPQTPRTPSSEGRPHSTVAQRSLLRVRSPPDGPIPRRRVTEPRTSEKWASPTSIAEDVEQDFAVDAAFFEEQGKSLKRQSASQNMRGSLGTIRSTTPLEAQRAEMRSDRSKRHSSGIIYGRMSGR